MDADLTRFDVLYNSLVDSVNAQDWPRVLGLINAQLTADRGMMRTVIVALKPVKDLPEIQVEFKALADALRAGSTHGII